MTTYQNLCFTATQLQLTSGYGPSLGSGPATGLNVRNIHNKHNEKMFIITIYQGNTKITGVLLVINKKMILLNIRFNC